MPLKRMLGESRSFAPESASILLKAFDEVVADLGLRTIEERERAARCIMRLALGQTELDVAGLRDATVALMRSESAAAGSSPASLSE